MKFGVIGTGYWGSNHARVASELQSEDIIDSVVFCDQDESRAKKVSDDYNAEYVTDHNELQSRVDAAVIATPSPTHEAIATDLLEGGVDCLVEKPLALSSDAAWNIVNSRNSNSE